MDLQSATHAQAAQTLKAVPNYSEVQLILQYLPQGAYVCFGHPLSGSFGLFPSFLSDYQRFEEKVERARHEMIQQQSAPPPLNLPSAAITPQQQVVVPRQEFYMRALFDNEPSRDAGGEIKGRGDYGVEIGGMGEGDMGGIPLGNQFISIKKINYSADFSLNFTSVNVTLWIG